MSWSVNGEVVGSSPEDTLESMKQQAIQQNPECSDQFDAARNAVYTIMGSGSVGGAGKKFNVVMSGHANPDHEPRDGWANDMINISISQV